MKRMLTNCPNCGAPLTSEGYCEYCKTKVRYANHMEILEDLENYKSDVEILLKIKKNDTTTLIPFKGRLDQIAVNNEPELYYNSEIIRTMSRPDITLTFEGHLGEIPKGEIDYENNLH